MLPVRRHRPTALTGLTGLAAVGVAFVVAVAGCASPPDRASGTDAAALAGVPAGTPPWSVVASTEISRGATPGTKRVTFSSDGTAAVFVGDGTASPVARFVLPTGRTSALTLRGKKGAARAPKPSYGLPNHNDPSVATNASGSTVAAWIEWEEVGEVGYHARLRAAFGAAGKPLGTPVTLRDARPNEPYLDSVAVDIDDDGKAVIVADDLRESGAPADIVAWIGSSATRLKTPLVVAPRGYAGYLDTVITPRGGVVVAWEPPQGGEDPHPPTPISAASLAPGAKKFSPVQVIERGSGIGYPQPFGLETGIDGTALLAWNGSPKRGGGAPLLVAKADRSGRFERYQQELITGERLGGLATREDGAAVITSVAEDSSTAAGAGSAFTLLPRGRAFGAREALPLPTSPSQGVGAPPVTFDPRSGRAVIAYVLAGTKTTGARLVVAVRDAPRALAPDPRDP